MLRRYFCGNLVKTLRGYVLHCKLHRNEPHCLSVMALVAVRHLSDMEHLKHIFTVDITYLKLLMLVLLLVLTGAQLPCVNTIAKRSRTCWHT